ncbi:MAG TPA: methyltransferase [Candidatus Binataceae bacterium]|nr:methyltransferase [Candidatus Binataceae bacterium]
MGLASSFLTVAVLLSFERITYIFAWRCAHAFERICGRAKSLLTADPVVGLRRLFYLFKALHGGVFLAWCYHFSDSPYLFAQADFLAKAAGCTLIFVGQTLNFGVFYRLRMVGVFYGNRFGRDIPWCREFPFSLVEHPQYLGAVISIWGFFLAARYPFPDWYLLPALETVYYALGAQLEA